MRKAPSSLTPIVNDKQFILATRDTGYRTTAAAIAELVDNAIQAGASIIRIMVDQIGTGSEREISISVLDNGAGMNARALTSAMQFAGSSRFDDRTGIGRFGMGLPNSSVSQARRVDVFTWQSRTNVLHTYLDIDEVSTERIRGVPTPRRTKLPTFFAKYVRKRTGTLICWTRCDRLESRKASTIAEHLHRPLGQRFRRFLDEGKKIVINNIEVASVDPLFLHVECGLTPARLFGGPLTFEFRVPSDPSRTSPVKVRFTELPVAEWSCLSVDQKRSLGLVKGAGVSIVRSNREIDFGWHFMGSKRKENYDDWWRCEVDFDPELDELFGVTHSKQEVNPTDLLRNALGSHLQGIAHTLNSRVRSAFALVRKQKGRRASRAEAMAAARDPFLPPLRFIDTATRKQMARDCREATATLPSGARTFRICTEELLLPDAFVWNIARSGAITVTVNQNHAFYDQVFRHLEGTASQKAKNSIECLLLAFARAGISMSTMRHADVIAKFNRSFSNALAAYLGD